MVRSPTKEQASTRSRPKRGSPTAPIGVGKIKSKGTQIDWKNSNLNNGLIIAILKYMNTLSVGIRFNAKNVIVEQLPAVFATCPEKERLEELGVRFAPKLTDMFQKIKNLKWHSDRNQHTLFVFLYLYYQAKRMVLLITDVWASEMFNLIEPLLKEQLLDLGLDNLAANFELPTVTTHRNLPIVKVVMEELMKLYKDVIGTEDDSKIAPIFQHFRRFLPDSLGFFVMCYLTHDSTVLAPHRKEILADPTVRPMIILALNCMRRYATGKRNLTQQCNHLAAMIGAEEDVVADDDGEASAALAGDKISGERQLLSDDEANNSLWEPSLDDASVHEQYAAAAAGPGAAGPGVPVHDHDRVPGAGPVAVGPGAADPGVPVHDHVRVPGAGPGAVPGVDTVPTPPTNGSRGGSNTGGNDGNNDSNNNSVGTDDNINADDNIDAASSGGISGSSGISGGGGGASNMTSPSSSLASNKTAILNVSDRSENGPNPDNGSSTSSSWSAVLAGYNEWNNPLLNIPPLTSIQHPSGVEQTPNREDESEQKWEFDFSSHEQNAMVSGGAVVPPGTVEPTSNDNSNGNSKSIEQNGNLNEVDEDEKVEEEDEDESKEETEDEDESKEDEDEENEDESKEDESGGVSNCSSSLSVEGNSPGPGPGDSDGPGVGPGDRLKNVLSFLSAQHKDHLDVIIAILQIVATIFYAIQAIYSFFQSYW